MFVCHAGNGGFTTDILILGQKIGLEEAYHQLVFGAARRSKILWTAFRQLYRLISPDRTSPLPLDDVFEAARALNDIYIHLRGMQDNYAWALLYLFGGDASKQLNQGDVSLFSKKFTNVQPIAEFVDIVKPFSDWNTELKAMRDPVAHRIPLSVPPAILDEADQKKYAEVNELYNAAQSRFAQRSAISPTLLEAFYSLNYQNCLVSAHVRQKLKNQQSMKLLTCRIGLLKAQQTGTNPLL